MKQHSAFTALILLLMKARTVVTYAVAIGPYPDDYYCDTFGLAHVMCEFFDVNRLCLPFTFWPRESLKKVVGDGIIMKHRNDYVVRPRGEELGLNPEDYQIPNMNLLVWDDELAALAERYVYQCPRTFYRFNDVARFRVAQMFMESIHPGRHEDITSLLVRTLLDPDLDKREFHILEKDGSKIELLSNFNPEYPMSVMTDPYFKYYGCAFAKMRQVIDIPDYKYFKVLLVCNFGPLTDDTSKKVQPRGKPCTMCPNGTKCLKGSSTPYLCQESDEPDETEQPPTAEPTTEGIQNLTTAQPSQSTVTNSTSALSTRAAATTATEQAGPRTTARGEDDFDRDCSITCTNGVPHASCAFRRGSSNDFKEVTLLRGWEVKKSILKWHNDIRNLMAGGIQGYPMAGNMREMQWNDILAHSAEKWASQCKPHRYECQDEYLTEGSDTPTRVTQLVAPFIWDTSTEMPPLTQAVQDWLVGKKNFSAEMLQSYLNPEDDKKKGYSSFAQLIWADTYMVGCAVALCHSKLEGSNENDTNLDYHEDLDEGESLILTICNYAPGGLVDGQAVYLVGGPCSLCTRLRRNNTGGMYCSHEYINLCSGASTSVPYVEWTGTLLIAYSIHLLNKSLR